MSSERIAHSIMAQDDQATREGWSGEERWSLEVVHLAKEHLALLEKARELEARIERLAPPF